MWIKMVIETRYPSKYQHIALRSILEYTASIWTPVFKTAKERIGNITIQNLKYYKMGHIAHKQYGG